MKRVLLRWFVTALGALYCTCVQFQTPLSAQPGCVSIDLFTEQALIPFKERGIPFQVLDAPDVVRIYLSYISEAVGQPVQGTSVFIFERADIVLLAIGWHTHICHYASVPLSVHKVAILNAFRGA